MALTIGVLGGMGPEATAAFYQRLVFHTPASCDQDHFRVLILSDPKIPDRSKFLLGNGPSPEPLLVDNARQLETSGASFLVIPCNTAHAFFDAISTSVKIPVLNIVDETVAQIESVLKTKESGMVAILATNGTLKTEIYQRRLRDSGLGSLVPADSDQEQIVWGIQQVKAGEDTKTAACRIQKVTENLLDQGAQAMIYGCTELGVLQNRLQVPVPTIDSLDCLSRATVAFALQRSPTHTQA